MTKDAPDSQRTIGTDIIFFNLLLQALQESENYKTIEVAHSFMKALIKKPRVPNSYVLNS